MGLLQTWRTERAQQRHQRDLADAIAAGDVPAAAQALDSLAPLAHVPLADADTAHGRVKLGVLEYARLVQSAAQSPAEKTRATEMVGFLQARHQDGAFALWPAFEATLELTRALRLSATNPKTVDFAQVGRLLDRGAFLEMPTPLCYRTEGAGDGTLRDWVTQCGVPPSLFNFVQARAEANHRAYAEQSDRPVASASHRGPRAMTA